MINASDALGKILEAAPRMKNENVPLLNALGRALAGNVVALENLPPSDISSMDGFAVRSDDLATATIDSPARLQISGEARAGKPFKGRLVRGSAVRITTGGVVPDGADAVVQVEEVGLVEQNHILVAHPVRRTNIRCVGEDVSKGETIMRSGEVIGASHLGLLAALGYAKIRVARRPRVHILATGDELVDVTRRPGPGKIRNSSSFALFGLVREAGGIPLVLGVVPDSQNQLKKRIRKALEADVLLITGGVSVGAYDYVPKTLKGLGVQVGFSGVNIKPGKPLLFGTRDKTLVFGLPGNPVSTAVTFLQFVRPALWKMVGREQTTGVRFMATCESSIEKTDGKRHFLRGVVSIHTGDLRVRLTGTQSSGAMSSMVKANCLVIIPEEVRSVNAGTKVEIELLPAALMQDGV